MPRPHLISASLVLLLSALSTGCGLVPVPYVRRFPAEIKGVRVVDARTGRDVPQAKMSFSISKYTNWMRDWPAYAYLPAGPDHPPAESGSDQLAVWRDTGGIFRVRPTQRLAVARLWGLGPLGSWIYTDYSASIEARADGYVPVGLLWHPGTSPVPGGTWSLLDPLVERAVDGTLILRLIPENELSHFITLQYEPPSPTEGYPRTQPARDAYLDAHRAGWDECLALFLEGGLDPETRDAEPKSRNDDDGFSARGRFWGFWACQKKLRQMARQLDKDLLRRALTGRGGLPTRPSM